MKRIAIVTWWISKEREISLSSAVTYIKHLDKTKYEVEVFDIPLDLERFIASIKSFDIVFPIIHGLWGEDWQITALCELQNVPVFFTTSQSHQLCIDKYLCTTFAQSKAILVPKTSIIYNSDQVYSLWEWEKVFVKPVHGWSSIDCGVCSTQQQLNTLISKVLVYDQVLIQEYVTWREFTISLVWDYDWDIDVFAISEIVTSQEFFDYDAKYSLKNTTELTPANISPELENEIITISKQIYKECKVTCLWRIDFIYQNNKLYFLEINTIPWFTETSFFPQAIKYKWIVIGEFLDSMINKIVN